VAQAGEHRARAESPIRRRASVRQPRTRCLRPGKPSTSTSREATRLYGALESSAEAAQSGAREIDRKAIGFAEKNVNAAFDFAQQLVRAKDPKEIVQLQQEFLKRQVEQMSGQMKELGEHATQTAQSAGAAARPGRS
jgi:phasin